MKARVLVDICSACAAACRYCLPQAGKAVRPAVMSHAQFTAVARILMAEGYDRIYTYMAGEPLLNPEFARILHTAGDLGFLEVSTATRLNARNVDWQMVGKAVSEHPGTRYDFLIGIDTLDPQIMARLAPGVDLDVVQCNLAGLCRETRAANCRRTLSFVKTGVNESSALAVQELARSLGLNYHERALGLNLSLTDAVGGTAELKDLIPAEGTHRFAVHGDSFVSRHSGRKFCPAALEPGIAPWGDVTWCCHDPLWAGSIGNVFETGSLDELLNGEKGQEMLQQCRDCRPDFCRGCT